ncbi:MAG: S-adenosylmethionine:tRNA ribosyltransferase-isomerase [Actinomycetota bacterium]|nr:MAG: S-adenosylmethionine:tRNA ribosyltransferase-isomerase [Actinomycetota bacterium]
MTTSRVASGPDARTPIEAGGGRRDDVRLLVVTTGAGGPVLRHHRLPALPSVLRAGDLVVVNTSATLPAAVDGAALGSVPVTVHAMASPGGRREWVVELRRPDRSGPVLTAAVGDVVELPGEVSLRLTAPFPAGQSARGARLWRAAAAVEGGLEGYLRRYGQPIAYSHVEGSWPLSAYQTVFATAPGPDADPDAPVGSAEMPSAARPLTAEVVTSLVAAGITIAPVVLHTGFSSPEAAEPPAPEWYRVPAQTARLVELTRASGGRVVAVGTTVTRALESAALPAGRVVPGEGWTDLVLGPSRPARVVSGLLTGWHEPQASHLLLLQAIAGPDAVSAAYAEAARCGYRWHEFGDSCLLLP